MRGVWLFFMAIGCAAPRPEPTRGTAPAARAAAPAQQPASIAASTPAPSAAAIVFSPRDRDASAGTAPAPKLEFVEPAFGDTLDPRFTLRQEVRVRVEGAAPSEPGFAVVVSLDGKHPRRLLSDVKLTIADLLSEESELAPGAHFLLAVAVDARGQALRQGSAGQPSVALSGFFAGTRASDALNPAFPTLFCLNPAGTFYVRPGAAVPFEVLALNVPAGRLPVRVRGPKREFETEIDVGRPYDVTGLELGDSRISIGRTPGPLAECVVTLNPSREASPP